MALFNLYSNKRLNILFSLSLHGAGAQTQDLMLATKPHPQPAPIHHPDKILSPFTFLVALGRNNLSFVILIEHQGSNVKYKNSA
jgi:hypothetical protein